ncbi:hypothetical protein [Spiroplasma floricola]|uniref:Uncharacterized protein n=1 Tax=Spiroplasma floricola 23-6 TaxID=1336749 RepID=A0A2K8SDI1_9MOLU|nr:hypothetical protein [Spiroplasma floricola]AUB31288.1 hypothetical protein SFLOR_v1c02270 [Spiroplasma floricola 23-6]
MKLKKLILKNLAKLKWIKKIIKLYLIYLINDKKVNIEIDIKNV